jgi:hypothetical protein
MQSAYSCKILTRSDLASCFAPPRGSQGVWCTLSVAQNAKNSRNRQKTPSSPSLKFSRQSASETERGAPIVAEETTSHGE